MTLVSMPPVFLRSGDHSPKPEKAQVEQDESAQAEKPDDGPVVCSQCYYHISEKDKKIVVDGSHTHKFVNPHGIAFRICCYETARCALAGPPSSEFTWFSGTEWQVALCPHCLVHLGWRFVGSHRVFFGLIADRLFEPGSGETFFR